MKKYIVFVLLFGFLIFGFSVSKVQAVTLSDIQKQLKVLSDQIASIKSRLVGQVITAGSCSVGSTIGDMDGNGILNANDSLVISGIINGSIPVGDLLCCADVDGDKTVTSTDATLVANYYNSITPTGFAGQTVASSCFTQPTSFVWTKQTSLALYWRSLTSSADGMKLAGIGAPSSGALNNIYTSIDGGVTWVKRNNSSPLNNLAWGKIASSADGMKLVAATTYEENPSGYFGGYIYTSTDGGATWTKRTNNLGDKNMWSALASSADGMKLVAVSQAYTAAPYASTNYVYTSTDGGVTWTRRESAGSRDWSDVASSSDGMKLVAAARSLPGNNGYIYTSTDGGVTWTERKGAGKTAVSVASSSDGMKLVAASNFARYIYTSTNGGITWTKRTSNNWRSWSAVAMSSDGNKILAADQFSNTGPLFISNNGGSSWVEQTEAGVGSWTEAISSDDGNRMAVARIPYGNNYGYVYTYGPGTTVPTTDLCSNISGVQTTIPTGMILSGNQCVPAPIDLCANISGVQTTIPAGMVLNGNQCVPVQTDLCPNISGIQTSIPTGMTLSGGQCVPAMPVDICPNINGTQTTIPAGMIIVNGQCVPEPVDLCSNISGVQTTIPTGMILSGNQCVPAPIDLCANISGVQTTIPAGMVLNGNQCVLSGPRTLKLGMTGEDVVEVQTWLISHGYIASLGKPGSVTSGATGIFDDITQDAVMRLQRDNGLNPDGIVGADTWKLIK